MRPRKIPLLVLALLFSILLPAPAMPQSKSETIKGRKAAVSEVLVRLKRPDQATLSKFQADYDLASQRSFSAVRGLYHFRSRSKSTAELISKLAQSSDVQYVEPNYLIQIAGTPNDPRFAELWGLHNYGQSFSFGPGTPGVDIGAEEAWAITTGSSSNTIAVIDTGIDYDHPDLKPNVWTAPNAFTVNIGGQVITCPQGSHGFNAITGTCDPFDDHGHGTHVSGTIGAAGNNSEGVVGVNWSASIIAAKFLDSSGSGYTSDAVSAIDFLMQVNQTFPEMNLRVVSNSWGGGSFSQALHDEIAAANFLFIFAAGNSSSNNDVKPFYPSNFDSENILSVAAIDNTGALASFSNYGVASVDIAAPGLNILSTTPRQTYSYMSGTSMATPHVAGAVYLLLSVCDLDLQSLKSTILQTVTPAANLSSLVASGGRLNIGNAIQVCTLPVAIIPATITYASQYVGTTSSARSAKLINNSAKPLNISFIGVTGPFTQQNNCPSTLDPHLSCSIQVAFAPTTTGSQSGILTIVHDDSSGASNVSLTGLGIVPPTITLSRTLVDFGTVTVSESSAISDFDVTNYSSAPINISRSLASPDFVIANDGCNAALVPQGSCSISVVFRPSSPGAQSTQLMITAPDGSIAQAGLSGMGIPTLGLKPSSIAFGGVTLTQMSAPKAVTITNNLTKAPLLLSGISTTGDFSQLNACPAQLAPGAGCSITVRFMPSQIGPRSGALVIAHSVGESTVTLTGSGEGMPDLVQGVPQLTSYSVGVGDVFQVTDTVTNVSTGTAQPFTSMFYLSMDGIQKTYLNSRTVNGLAPGASSGPVTTALAFPLDLSGSYYVMVCADSSNAIPESNENNNCALSAPITAILGDLAESSISLLTNQVVAGGTVTVSDNTFNAGLGTVGPSVTVFYLSSDGTSRSYVLGTRTVGSLASQVSAGTATTLLGIPTSVSGSYYLLACADAYSSVKETNETNNCLRTSRFDIASVDLKISAITMLTQAPAAGMASQATETTINLGPGVSAQSVTGFYLSRDGLAKSYSVGTRVIPSLPAGGASQQIVTSLNIPQNLSGTFYLIACADAQGTIKEVNETNNCLTSSSFNVTGPDLAVTAVMISNSQASPGSLVQITDTTANLSPAAIPQSVTGFYLSRDGITKNNSLGNRIVPSLQPNVASGPTSTSLLIPSRATGTYYVLACADSSGGIAESNESNNCSKTAQINIQ